VIPNQEIDGLAEEMKNRYARISSTWQEPSSSPSGYRSDLDNPEQQPFVLFLGPKCATAAGVPNKEQIARSILDLVAKDNELNTIYPLVGKSLNLAITLAGDDLLTLFYDLMAKLKKGASGKIYRILLKLYANVPVPLFYQDLALLIKADYFERILTTNIDTLLEQALNIAGLQAGFDYQVFSLGVAEDDPNSAGGYGALADWGQDAQPRQIIKLFGDLAQEQVNIIPEDIDKALKNQRRYVKSELEGDIVMVGYDFESKPINTWLKHGGTRRGQLWWVGEEVASPPPDAFPQDWANRVHFITGEIGRPQEFFSQLKLRLLRRPTFVLSSYSGEAWQREGAPENAWLLESIERSSASAERQEQSVDDGSHPTGKDAAVEGVRGSTGTSEESSANTVAPDRSTLPTASAERPPEETSLIEDLRGNIRRGQAVLSSLEQSVAPGEVPTQVRAQVIYQKKQIAEMEDKLRSLKSNRDNVIQALTDLVRDLQSARATGVRVIDEPTLHFLQQQAQSIKEEYARSESNHFVISAALGATVILAERLCIELGAEVVKPEHVRQLAAFAPSVAGRGII
jgi:hypothetical protein